MVWPSSKPTQSPAVVNLELSMKCPSRPRVTAHKGSPSQPRHIGLNSKVTSRLWTKCPIEVGVGREVNLAFRPVCLRFEAKWASKPTSRLSAVSEMKI